MRCNDARLERFLVADESSAEFQSVSSHVENCSHCQQRLVQLSGDNHLLCELRETLQSRDATEDYHPSVGSSVVISVDAGLDDECGAECEPVSLEFLAPPSHPEMLGRIGRYEVERMIGSGGMGIVLKGFDTELHRVVAIKVLKPHLAHIGAARHRFAREAQSAAAVVHEHVIPIYDVQSDGEMPFLVMQYVPGQSLQARVDERGPLDPKEVLRISMQAAAGLAAAHAQGLVHRDVKPANILMEESVERVLISDFGLARTVDDATLTRTGIVAGTPHYMSPEQASGQPVDHRSDLFSLGSAIYFMCTGRPPFRAEHALAILNRICHDPHRPVDEVNHDVPAELAEIVDQLLSKNPGDRFRNAQEVEQRLGAILALMQNGQRSTRLRWRRGWQRWRATVKKATRDFAIVATCIFIGVGIARWTWQKSPNPPDMDATVHETAPLTNSIDGNQLAEGEAPATIPSQPTLDPALPDPLHNAMEKVGSVIEAMEHRWKQFSPRLFDSSDDAWQRELDQIRATIQSLERRSAQPNTVSVPFPSDSTERTEQ